MNQADPKLLGSAFFNHGFTFYYLRRNKHLDMGWEWEGMGIPLWELVKKWEWEWEGMGIDSMGMGGSGNLKSHSRSSLLCTPL